MPSRSTSPHPQFYPFDSSFSCTSDSENETPPDFLRNRNLWWRENRRSWWSASRRRRKRDGRILRFLKRWTRRLIRHPLFPSQPITIVLSLILLSIFAICLTLLLIYILNPDKEPLPWRAYCSNPSLTANFDPYPPSEPYPFHRVDASSTKPSPFPPQDLDSLSPTGIFIGVFSVDSSFERRMLVRTTWATHQRSRDGAGEGDDGIGTSRTIVRFILGQPRKDWERRIKLEMETFNDIIILPMSENMNRGKTHTFFSWAAINAWVPPVYSNISVTPPSFSYSNHTASPPALAPHDSPHAWQDQYTAVPQSWVRPDYVVKADDDSFVMLAELEARLRVELHTKPKSSHGRTPEFSSMLRTETTASFHNTTLIHRGLAAQDMSGSNLASPIAPQVVDDPLIYWGYLVTNRLHKFMAGELYALSWSLVDWAAKDPAVKGVTKGAEDKQTAKWMKLHPRSSEIRWVSERCWIYDHPRSGTVYSHGFLYPSEATRIKRSMMSYMDKTFIDALESSQGSNLPSAPAAWAYSTVSTFGVRYVPPLPDLSIRHSVEALVEGSDMSMIREGSPMTPDYAWTHREGRKTRYEGKRVGGTVVVHFIKKNIWYLETALALLDGEEQSEFEKFQSQEIEKALARTPTQSHMTRRAARTQRRLS
ncbi:Beta-1,3-galactosyltransferase pvg3 [Termitomyces sp. J132]|nr:Beta-1,3-galactosyltransferase pvg3 [Termitomyces sp. J132]